MKLESPTGNWNVRNDAQGLGSYGASRGRRSHHGVDLLCVKDQVVLSPINGKIVREAFPYAGDLKWSGCLLTAPGITVKLFYMRLYHHLRKKFPYDVFIGQPIGLAQDISQKHGGGMLPHVHMEIKTMQYVDPMEWA